MFQLFDPGEEKKSIGSQDCFKVDHPVKIDPWNDGFGCTGTLVSVEFKEQLG